MTGPRSWANLGIRANEDVDGRTGTSAAVQVWEVTESTRVRNRGHPADKKNGVGKRA